MTSSVAAKAAATVVGAVVLADQASGAGAMDPLAGAGMLGQGAGAVGFAASLWVFLVGHRTWSAVDTVIEVVENKTVQSIEVIGDDIIHGIPIVIGLLITLCCVLVRMCVVKHWSGSRKLAMLRGGQNLEGNLADMDTSFSQESYPEPRSLLRPKSQPAIGIPPVQPRNPCHGRCSFWATANVHGMEWVGYRCSGQCTETKGHPRRYCACEIHAPSPTNDDRMNGARPGSPSVMPAPGAFPELSGVDPESVEWKKIEENALWFKMPWLSEGVLTYLIPNYEGACELIADPQNLNLGVYRRKISD